MRMNADKIGKSLGKTYKVFQDEVFQDLSDPSFQFILFSSYRTSAIPANLTLKVMAKWAQDYKFTNFLSYERLSERTDDHWDPTFFKGKLPDKVAKVLISGVKSYVLSVRQALIQCGIPEDIIIEL